MRDEGATVTIHTDPGEGPRNATWRRKPKAGPTREVEAQLDALLADPKTWVVTDWNNPSADAKFAQPVLDTPTRSIVGMVRGDDPIECQAAAVRVRHDCKWIRWRILGILATEGPQTARALETRNEFRGFAENTIRRRITDLKQSHAVVQVGREDGMAKWSIADDPTPDHAI